MTSHIFYYLLDDNNDIIPVEPPVDYNVIEKLLSDSKRRRVGLTQIGSYRVSTVFLVIAHISPDFNNDKIMLFETMVFKDDDPVAFGEKTDLDRAGEILFGSSILGNCRRYATWDEAKQGHKETVRMITSCTGLEPCDE